MPTPWLSLGLLLLLLHCVDLVPGEDEWQRPHFFGHRDAFEDKYSYFPEELRLQMLQETKDMFTFGYDAYMKYAFPLDELDPIHCRGRGPDYSDPSNININDALGNYSLTLIDTLDTLAIMGNSTEFHRAVKLVVDTVSFDTPSTVQLFEANIRILGGLLSAHLLMQDKAFAGFLPDWYLDELLTLAHDLADRLLSAFDDTATGLPHPRVNLKYGLPDDPFTESCTAGAGSLVLEFGMLSRLLDDPVYESYARKAIAALWSIRDQTTGLLGNVMNIQTGRWVSRVAGLGAGMDSFYEYLLKSHIAFEEKSDLLMFQELYNSVKTHMRRGRDACNRGTGPHPIYVNVDMTNGATANHWIDSLQAAFSGIQVLFGDLDEAVCHHALYYAIWKRFDSLPERFNWKLMAPDVKFYPLRPEFVEATYLLYQATKNPFYLHVGKDILQSLNIHTKVRCGYATIHDVENKSLEDRQESFFLSETCKYLYLLFDVDNPINKEGERFLFTTEGHVLPISNAFRRKSCLTDTENESESDRFSEDANDDWKKAARSQCPNLYPSDSTYRLPIKSCYLSQVFAQVGLDFH